MSDDKQHGGNSETPETPEKLDKPTDNTVENSEEMGGGYGGPAPVTPEDEQAD